MVVNARRTGLSVSETNDITGISPTQTALRFYRELNSARKRLVDVRGQWKVARLLMR